MKKLILLLFLFAGLTGFSKTWILKNAGNTFTPASLTIELGDSVKVTIGSMHDAVEVSKEIWEAGESSPMLGGFKLPMGGGLILPAQLAAGSHYYVFTPHVTLGMKGVIVVLGPSNISSPEISSISLFPNPATDHIAVKTPVELLGSNYRILDITGKEIATGKLENYENRINISNLSTGIYFLQTLTQKEETFKFIKAN